MTILSYLRKPYFMLSLAQASACASLYLSYTFILAGFILQSYFPGRRFIQLDTGYT
ncbi:hypothetical protein [Pontibacter flavimaris]|uniref:hypothetical protein n=1 Tax=Pontibacter flavimaris TaxID=1797110 RepID=UPI0014817F9E|nr:hypothetical protein [Pontibacter flavimaris]